MTNQNLKNQETTLSPDIPARENTKDLVPQSLSQKTIIVSEISQTQEDNPHLWQWRGHEWMLSLKQDCLKAVEQPTNPKLAKGSSPLLLWETCITVGLLVMALWMQTIPAWQPPTTVNNNSLPLSLPTTR